MDENFKLIGEYTQRLFQGVGTEGWLLLVLSAVLLGMVAYYNSSAHIDRVAAKRKALTRKQKVQELARNSVVDSLENLHKTGKIHAEELDAYYKGLGFTSPRAPEPFRLHVPKNILLIKDGIRDGVKLVGSSLKGTFSKLRGIPLSKGGSKTAKEEMDELRASIRSTSKA